MKEIYCMGHGGHVAASDMMTNFQHKNHICKACHANIIKTQAKEKEAVTTRRIADHIDTLHEKASKEVTALMGKPKKQPKIKPSIFSKIEDKRYEMEMAKLEAGLEL